MNKKKITILISSAIVIVIVVVIAAQLYPVALVDRRIIAFRSFKKGFAATLYYYQKVSETYNPDNLAVIESQEVKKEVERALLDKLIENVLIQRELRGRFKKSELEAVIENKIEEAIKGKNIEKEVQTLYNLSLDEFRKNLLKPQAEREVLTDRFFLENKNFNDWLKETKLKTRVIILLPNLEWKEGEIIIK